jgi:small subunit ribosomal protein S18
MPKIFVRTLLHTMLCPVGATHKETLSPVLFQTVDYKNVKMLRRYIGITGKIFSRKITGLTAKNHRQMSKSIRRARRVGLLPFVWLLK